MSSSNPILAFDLYNTLVDTTSVENPVENQIRHAHHYIHHSTVEEIVAQWRILQLQYTWRLNSMEQYIPWDEVTTKALCHALGRKGINDETDEDLKAMEEAYNRLKTFPEVRGFLESLVKSKTDSYIFSNGTVDMIAALVENNPALQTAFLTPTQDKICSVDQRVRKYKPHPDVYADFVQYVGRTGNESSVVLVSSNSFDIVGARKCGWTTIWVDRKQTGWVDRLASKPHYVVHDVGEVLWIIDEIKKKNGGS